MIFLKRCKAAFNGGSLFLTIYYNFKLLPLRQAIKLPIIVGKHTTISGKGRIVMPEGLADNPKMYVGCRTLKWLDKKTPTVIFINGTWILPSSNMYIGSGTRIEIEEDAELIVKEGLNITGLCTIICRKRIVLGEDVLVSWDTQFMDSDAHAIWDKDGFVNEDKPIEIGEHVWVGCRTTILKGSKIPTNTIVASGCLVSGCFMEANTILAGVPAKVIKKSINWSIEKPN